MFFSCKSLYFLHSRDNVLQVSVEFPQHPLIDAEQRRHLFGVQTADGKHDRERQQGKQRQQRINEDDHDAHQDNDNNVREHIRQSMRKQHFQISGVIERSAHDLPCFLVAVPGE